MNDAPLMMTVIVDGKEDQREVDYIETSDPWHLGALMRHIPVLHPGEEMFETVSGIPVIIKRREK